MTAFEEVAGYSDVPIRIEVHLDRRVMTIRDILNLGTGSVIRMTRSAGENLDILVGSVLVGFGEIVITDTTTGVRITDFKQQEQ